MIFCFFFKQKSAYEMRISDWSSDVCSSDLYSLSPFREKLTGLRQRKRAIPPGPPFCIAIRGRRSDFRGQFRHRIEQIGHQAEVRDLKDRGVFVLVDRDDGLVILHACKMLDRARDADRELDFRRDELSGFADRKSTKGRRGGKKC